MSTEAFQTETAPAVQAYLLDRIDFAVCLELQQRLLSEVAGRDDGQITLLLCEHPQIITVGRGGSPADLANESHLLRSRQIEVRWVNRGGGCLLHCPGQLAIYPLVPLRWHGFSVGEYLERLQAGVIEALDDLNIHGQTPPARHGVWGRTGQLAAVGVAVRNWVTYYGAYINVCPPMGLFRLVDSDPAGRTPMSCLVAERRGPVRMTTVRSTLLGRLTAAFGCDRYHLYTGHPLLRRTRAVRQREEKGSGFGVQGTELADHVEDES
jgi:lipoyl(octanoyl) transferase